MKKIIFLTIISLLSINFLIASTRTVSRSDLNITLYEAYTIYKSVNTSIQIYDINTNLIITLPATWNNGDLTVDISKLTSEVTQSGIIGFDPLTGKYIDEIELITGPKNL